MKTLIIIFLFLFTNLSLPQYQQKELLHIDVNSNNSVLDVSSNGFMILNEKIGTSNKYYLSNIRNIQDKKLIFSSNDSNHDFIRFSSNDELIIFRTKENEKFVVHIYNIDKQLYVDLEHPSGDVVSASAINEDTIIYQLRQNKSLPQIYKYSSSSNSSGFLTEGIGEVLSPNGKWFFVKKYDKEANLLRNELMEGKISKEEFLEKKKNIQQERLKGCIYNLNGELILQLDYFKNQIVEVDWSNDSQKIVVRELGDRGFHILYFNQVEEGLQIANQYHFNGIQSIEGLYNISLKPIWSLDGNQLLFVNSSEDGHDIISMDLWILEDHNYKLFPLSSGITNTIIKTSWQNNNNVIFVENDRNQSFYNVKGFFINQNGEE